MILTRAPLRIPLGGGGTDFPSFYNKYGGYILGFAIQRYVYVVLHPTSDKKYHLKYSKIEVCENLDQMDNRVAAETLKHFNVDPGLEISTFSDVPESSGLGGSSSFCAALVLAIRKFLGQPIDSKYIYADSYEIERRKAKQPGGFQDQYFASFGGARELSFSNTYFYDRPIGTQIMSLLPNLRLVYVGGSSKRLDIAKNQDFKVNEGDSKMVSSLLTVKEIGQGIKKALDSNDYQKIGSLFNTHWESKKLRDPNITSPEIDLVYSKGLEYGATGGKLIGMGGGGYILFCGDRLNGQFPSVELKLDTEGAKMLYKEVN